MCYPSKDPTKPVYSLCILHCSWIESGISAVRSKVVSVALLSPLTQPSFLFLLRLLLGVLQARAVALEKEAAELQALRSELNQRERELARKATDQASEAAALQVRESSLNMFD